MFVLGTKGAGGMGKIVCRIVVFLLIYFLSLLFSLSLVCQYGGWGEGLYEPKARNLTFLEHWDQRLAGGKT